MEEADILSTKIAIMAKGTLRCVGTPLHLKKKYGNGFMLTVYFKRTIKEIPSLEELESIIGNFRKIDDGFKGHRAYEIDNNSPLFSIIEYIEQNKEKLSIEDWGIAQTSLEEVFLNIIKDDDADASN
jgi:ABC-type multidrug transport system ATPase subunit